MQFYVANWNTREEIYRWMGGQKTPLKTNAADVVDIPALVDGIRNDDVAAEQLRIGSGWVDLYYAFAGILSRRQQCAMLTW